MKKSILLICGFLFTLSLMAQEPDSLIVNNIEKIVNNIDNNPVFSRLHEDGELTKKRLLFFEKQIGGFYSNIVYADSIVLSIENEYFYTKNSQTKKEKYYFKHNRLIKYIEELRIKNKLEHRIVAYFYNERLLKVNDKYVIDLAKQKKILTKAKNEFDLRKMTTSEWNRLFK